MTKVRIRMVKMIQEAVQQSHPLDLRLRLVMTNYNTVYVDGFLYTPGELQATLIEIWI